MSQVIEEKAMAVKTVHHASFAIEREFRATPSRVYAALAEPEKKRRWFMESDPAKAEDLGMDFRVGGWERKRFTLPNGMVCTNETVYLDIVAEKRVVFAYTMAMGERRFSASMGTFELLAAAGGTKLIFTEQAAFFEAADGPEMREAGWTELLARLEKALAAAS